MARVPDYSNRQVSSRPVGAQGFTMRGPDASGLARGVAQAEKGVMAYVERERESADTAAVLEADRRLTEWQNQTLFDEQNGVYTRRGGNALNVTNETLESFEKTQSEIGRQLTSEQQRERFNQVVASRRSSIANDLNRYEFSERQRYYDDVDNAQVETAINTAALNFNDPEKIVFHQNKMAAVLQAQAMRKGLSEEAFNAQLVRANSSMSKAVISRMANDDPYRARDYFNEAQGAMTADDQIQMERLIDREIRARELQARQMQAIARAELSSRIQDAEAAYLQGLDFAQPPEVREFVGAFGAEEGQQRYQQFLRAQELGSDLRTLATADPQERAELISKYNPAPDGVASDGFRQDAQMMGVAVTAITNLSRELENDPASYAAKYSPLIRSAMEGLSSGEPAAAEAYAAATLAEQARLGAVEPRLLSKSQADAIVRQFQVTPDGGSNAAAMISDMQEQWGKYWPQVYKELQPDLPGAALVIGSGVDEATAATLARIAPMSNDDLRRGLESIDVSDGRGLLNEQLAPLRLTLAQQPGGDRTYATLDREAERLMLAYMGQGKSHKDAVNEVTRALVDDKYTIRGSWRAPVQYDARMIERGSELTVRELDASSLLFNVPAGLDADFAAERVKTAIEREGYWVTNPDETGLVLYYGGAAVLDKDGVPVMRNWEQLIGEGLQRPPMSVDRILESWSEGMKRIDGDLIDPFSYPAGRP